MAENAKKFHTVFEKMDFPTAISNPLKNADISNIKLSRAEKKIKIDMELSEMVHEKCFLELQNNLISKFPFINTVEINHKYNILENDSAKKIKLYWDNILYQVDKISPICCRILEGSIWEVEGASLVIRVPDNGSFLFLKRGIDKKIQSMLTNNLETPIHVKFVDQEKVKKERYIAEIQNRETKAIREAIVSNANPENRPKAPKTESAQKPWGEKSSFKKSSGGGRKNVRINKELTGVITRLDEALETDEEILINGLILNIEMRETKSGKFLFTFDVTDKKGSITIKLFLPPDKYDDDFKTLLKKGNPIKVLGRVQFDTFSKEINIMAIELCPSEFKVEKRMDNSTEKRVELHLHTNMSQMDAVTTAKTYIKRAQEWGHNAIAITDHGIVQAFPEAMEAAKGTGVKIIYGVEAYLVDDLAVKVAQRQGNKTLESDFVVFDLETTGLHKDTCTIIEIGAVKIQNGLITGRYNQLINPRSILPNNIVKLTNITDDMLRGQPTLEEILPEFVKFCGDSVLVAHNADFDMGFYETHAKKQGYEISNSYLCTVQLSRALFPDLHNHKLNTIAKHLDVSLENHHRAVDDAAATAEIFLKCIGLLKEQGIESLSGINALASKNVDTKKLKHKHAIILVKNYTGLRNLYELVSKAHIDYFYKRPRIPKSEFNKLREGLIIGTACEAGEFYLAVRENKPEEYIRELAEFYDYLEIQPVGNNMYLYREGHVDSVQALADINKRIVDYGEKYNKPVVATCDVHFIDPEDEVYRRIIMSGDGFKDADNQPPLFYRTTEEMLKEFDYLGPEKAREVVITNTNMISDMIENIKPIPDETFPPNIEGAEEELTQITMKKAKEIYGDPLPQLVADRLDRELGSIIKNGFSVLYIIAQKLVWNSVEHGYLVGSRGSVGSSFVATMAEITEVNPLPPHYYCGNCKYSDFDSNEVKAYVGASGCDMPDKNCPNCGTKLKKEGHDIPFETFLGFDGDKEPDIDLNFSGEYQAKAHAYTEELFGTGFVFKAGTIGTLADKTAYGYVKKYLDERNRTERNAEINRLVSGCTGIKRTTGQHPGGLMIVPNDHSIYEFCPVQRPANDMKSDVITTHFDYHSISGRLLKLDLLGHDVPTIIRMLHDITGVDPRTVELGDVDTISLFRSPEALKVTAEEINCKTGTLGLPEFGTSFVRQMLLDTMPSTFAELVRISGLSHGTDVWFNNGQDLIRDGVATLKEIIPTRDDIMVYLINMGVEKKASFKIMENVRKGKGLTDAEVEVMQAADVPEWYIESCRRIKYMFPKGHAAAYVMMTIRIGYFKINYPYAFYAAMFSVKANDFDYELMCKGKDTVKNEMNRINAMGNEASAKEKSILTLLELVYEMYARGYNFVPLDLYKSSAKKFIVTNEGLMPPLCSVQGLGENAAQAIVEARGEGEFYSIEDFKNRTKTTKTVIELLKENRILQGIPETDQLSLF